MARNRFRNSLSASPDLQPQLMSLPHRRIHYHKHDALEPNGLAHYFSSLSFGLVNLHPYFSYHIPPWPTSVE